MPGPAIGVCSCTGDVVLAGDVIPGMNFSVKVPRPYLNYALCWARIEKDCRLMCTATETWGAPLSRMGTRLVPDDIEVIKAKGTCVAKQDGNLIRNWIYSEDVYAKAMPLSLHNKFAPAPVDALALPRASQSELDPQGAITIVAVGAALVGVVVIVWTGGVAAAPLAAAASAAGLTALVIVSPPDVSGAPQPRDLEGVRVATMAELSDLLGCGTDAECESYRVRAEALKQ
jgi:hypothetical protein